MNKALTACLMLFSVGAFAENIIRTPAPIAKAAISDTKKMALSIGSLSLPVANQNSNYSHDVSSQFSWSDVPSGTQLPQVSWSATGLPSGIALSSGGVFTGAPVSYGAFPLTVTLAGGGYSAVQSTLLTVEKAAPISLSLLAPLMPAGVVGTPYSYDLSPFAQWENVPSGMTNPVVTWSATGLPSGLSINSAGTISGTPLAAGTFPVNINGVSGQYSAAQTASLSITPYIGDKPLYVGVQSLYRFNGNAASEGSWNGGMTNFGPALGVSVDSPISDQSKSMVFNGTNGIISANGPLTGTTDYSVGAWINPSNVSSFQTIIQQRDYDNDGQFVIYIGSGQIVHYDYNPTLGVQGVNTGSVPIQTNTWMHLAVVRSGSVTSIYINGKKVSTYTRTNGVVSLNPTNGLSIGLDQRDNSMFYMGKMKDVFVMNRKLSDAEILWLGTSGEGFPTP